MRIKDISQEIVVDNYRGMRSLNVNEPFSPSRLSVDCVRL